MKKDIKYYTLDGYCKGVFRDGMHEGEWINYSHTGEIICKNYYWNGDKITEKEWQIHCNLELILK